MARASYVKHYQIDKNQNGVDLCGNTLYIEDRQVEAKKFFQIVADKRVGIDYAEEAKDYLWRYYIEEHPYVSVVAKKSIDNK